MNSATDGPSENPVNTNSSIWRRARIAILGMTHPHYSLSYGENACTGGIQEETKKLVRIYPIPHQFLSIESRPHAFQWLRVDYSRSSADPRPESIHINPASIRSEDGIPSKDVDKRRLLLETCDGHFRSVEELKDAQKRFQTSLGIIVPKEIISIKFDKRDEQERKDWKKREKQVLSQETLLGIGTKMRPISFPDTRFMITFLCDDSRCRSHQMGLEDWGIQLLWLKLKGDADRVNKTRSEIERRLDTSRRDLYFYLGNFRDKPWNFGLMGVGSLRKQIQKKQLSLSLG